MRFCYNYNFMRHDNNMNITKTMKTILFAGLIAAMILPFSGMNYAEAKADKYEASEVADAINLVTPYVALDENGIASFTVKTKDIPLDKKTIKIATNYMKMQNSYTSQAKDNPNKKPTINKELRDKFSNVEKDIKEKKYKSKNSITNTISLEWILPEAFALWGDVCGGQAINPHPAPTIYNYYRSQGAVAWLGSNGHSLVPSYASNNYGSDYGKVVNAYGCGNGEMRAQAVVTSYNYHTSQQPEPNPDINSYTAPVWWWDGYVFLWHVTNP